MAGDASKCLVTVFLLALCLLLCDARPGFSRAGEPLAGIMLAAGPSRHVIKAGETINLLAVRYGVPAAAILKANPGLNPSRLPLGKEIVIPSGGQAATPVEVGAPQAAKPLELRPEKAPQATQPLSAAPVGRDLTDAPAKPAVVQPATPDKAATAAVRDVSGAPGRPQIEESSPARPAAPAAAVQVPPDERPAVGPWSTGGIPWLPVAIATVVVLLLGFALRGLLANFAAGLALVVFRFFRPGDIIRVAGHMGRVVSRGRLYVVIRTPDNERVIVPNARLISEVLVVLPSNRDGD